MKIINVNKIQKSREQEGYSICIDCGNEYTNYEIEKGFVTPCVTCYKCYNDECPPFSCDCNSDNEIKNYLNAQI